MTRMARESGYDFYLERCLLPVAPKELEVKINNANKTITLINEGEVNLLKTAGLTDIEFECMIPQVRYPFAVYAGGFQDAKYFLDYFERLKTRKSPFQFIVSRSLPQGRILFSTNIKVSMEDYRITEQATDGFDPTVKISLKQYRDYGTKTVSVKMPQAKPKATVVSPPPQATVVSPRPAQTSPAPKATQTYTVKAGDCLWNIAKQLYGNGADYTKIYNANKGTVGSDPNLIYPGQVLTIPAA